LSLREPTGRNADGPAFGVPPEVTVIIPTRNRREFLLQAVHDALCQEGVSLEVVVVDDGSTIQGAVDGIEALDERIRVYRHDVQQGVARARNTGISNARGTWLAFFDDDDRWSPAKLRTQLEAAREVEAEWAYSGALTIDTEDRILTASAPPDRRVILRWLVELNAIPGGCSNLIATVDAVRDVGGFDERLALVADWDLWIRLAEKARPAVCQEQLVGYRLHSDNMHVRDADRIGEELSHIARKYNGTRLGDAVQPDLSHFLGWQGYALRRGAHRRAASRVYLKRWRLTRDVADVGRAVLSLLGEPISGAILRRRRMARVDRPGWLDDHRRDFESQVA
jgi:glycosyltransferase involved in cell wall biosynthesis